MTDLDYAAELICLLCVVAGLACLYICDELLTHPLLLTFIALEIPRSFIWFLNAWSVWTYFFPCDCIVFAAAAGECVWKLSGKFGRREKVWARTFAGLVGGLLAYAVVLSKPLFPKFSSLSLLIAMSAVAAGSACSISASVYGWKDQRTEGALAIQAVLLAAYGVLTVAATGISARSDAMWDASVQASCVLRGAILFTAVMTVCRRRGSAATPATRA